MLRVTKPFMCWVNLAKDYAIGVIAKLDKQSLVDLVKDIDTLEEGKCNCGCK